MKAEIIYGRHFREMFSPLTLKQKISPMPSPLFKFPTKSQAENSTTGRNPTV